MNDVKIEWKEDWFIFAIFSFLKSSSDHITLGDEFIIENQSFNEIGTLYEVGKFMKVKMRSLNYIPDVNEGYKVWVVFKSTPFNWMRTGLEQFSSYNDYMSPFIKQSILGKHVEAQNSFYQCNLSIKNSTTLTEN